MNHDCNICDGVRPHNGSICLGCGSQLARCKRPTVKQTARRCAACGSGSFRPVRFDASRVECQACGAVFEEADGYAVDTRPDVNAEKRERASKQIWKGGRR